MQKMAERQKRAAQPVMKKTGKPLMTRHMQQTRKKTEDDTDIDNEEEDVIKANIILKRRLSEFESKYKEKVE